MNAGSLPEDLRDERTGPAPSWRRPSARSRAFDEAGLQRSVVVSMKASETSRRDDGSQQALRLSRTTCRSTSASTEAGPLIAGVARNTAALVPLLREGIGSTDTRLAVGHNGKRGPGGEGDPRLRGEGAVGRLDNLLPALRPAPPSIPTPLPPAGPIGSIPSRRRPPSP